MSGGRCCSGGLCCLFAILAVIAGFIASIFTGVLFDFILLPWIILGGALLFLVLLLTIIFFTRLTEDREFTCCVCKNYFCLLVGIAGSIIASAVTIILGCVTPILVFFVVAFALLMLLAMIALIACLAGQLCD